MKILVLGASQGTGALTVRRALAQGHAVTAFARTPARLALEHPQFTKRVGDFHDAQSVAAAVAGHDAVVITASASKMSQFKETPNFFSLGTAHAIAAMQAQGVRRLVVLSALGTGDSRGLIPFLLRPILLDFALRLPFADHERQEALVRASGLDWVIARPGRLTDGDAKGRYVANTAVAPVPASISRADVAHFLVRACEEPAWVGHAVHLGG